MFKIYDEDTVSDELVGSIHLELKDIVPDANGNKGKMCDMYDWKNIYGAPLSCSGSVTDKMNNNPEIASLWKGRILVQCTVEETEKPLLLIRKIEPEEVEKAEQHLKNRSYSLSLFIAGAIGLPYDNKDF